MLIVRRFDDSTGKGFGRFSTDHIVNTLYKAPSLPGCEQSRKGVCQTVLRGGNDNPSRAARQTLHVTENERRSDTVRLACSSSCHDHGRVRPYELSEALRCIKVYWFLLFHPSPLQIKFLLPSPPLQTPHPRCPCSPHGISPASFESSPEYSESV